MKDLKLENINLYRITHIDNIPHILQYGITHRNSVNADPDYKAIGETSIIACRSSRAITVGEKTINLGDYIPFYFGLRMPMLYVIQRGGNYVPERVPPKDIVYIAVSLKLLKECGITGCFFTDGHAVDALTSFYDENDIDRIPELVDWDSVRANKWSGENIPTEIKRKKQAEFLVGSDIDPTCIIGYVCYNDEAKHRLEQYGVTPDRIVAAPKYYY